MRGNRGLLRRLGASARVLAAAAPVDRDRSAAVQDVALTADDWAALPAAAIRHGLTPVLDIIVRTRGDVPDEVRAAAADQSRLHLVGALRGAAELVLVMAALSDAGVRAVALKGPAFSQWLYGDVAFRRFADLDIVVAPEDLDAAFQALHAAGYRLPDGMSPRSARAIYGGLGAWPLTAAGRYPLDLHWRTSHRRFAPLPDAAAMVARSRSIDMAGRRIVVPSPEDAALLTLLHAAKHLWCTLEVLLAIARLLQRTDIAWDRVREDGARAHAWPACAAGVQLASELFDVELPAALRGIDGGLSIALQDQAIAALLMPHGQFHERWAERVMHRAGFDRWIDRVRYDAWRLLAPTPLEWQWCRLPDSLTPLYVPLRLVRLSAAAIGLPTGRAAAPDRGGDASTPTTRAGRG